MVWRTYWKGWLEQRPAVWTRYRATRIARIATAYAPVGPTAEWLAGLRVERAVLSGWAAANALKERMAKAVQKSY